MSMRATGRPRGGVSLKNMDRAALKRLVGYILRRKGMLAAVLICIALSSIANVASSLFLQSLIDDYIAPLLLDAAPVFTGLLKAIVTMGCIYVVGHTLLFVLQPPDGDGGAVHPQGHPRRHVRPHADPAPALL